MGMETVKGLEIQNRRCELSKEEDFKANSINQGNPGRAANKFDPGWQNEFPFSGNPI
jgi:hypothetical protein